MAFLLLLTTIPSRHTSSAQTTDYSDAGLPPFVWGVYEEPPLIREGDQERGDAIIGPESLPGRLEGVDALTQISAGGNFDLALRIDGTVWAWGANDNGQLGQGDTEARDTPVQVRDETGSGFLESVLEISAGARHALAVRSDGIVLAWGSNADGQLGDGTTTDSALPIALPVLGEGVKAVAAGSNHSLALELGTGRQVWSWGSNSKGQLGRCTSNCFGNVPDALHPARIDYARVLFDSIDAGAEESIGIGVEVPIEPPKRRGASVQSEEVAVWGWGDNSRGQLGSPPDQHPQFSRATRVHFGDEGGAPAPEAVSAGFRFNAILDVDGGVWMLGANEYGQLGVGSTDDRTAGTRVVGLEDVVIAGVSAGYRHAVAFDETGSAWAWGGNSDGQLGTGDVGGQQTIPVAVIGVREVRAVAAGTWHSAALAQGARRLSTECVGAIAFDPEVASPGAVVRVHGSGFEPGSKLTLSWNPGIGGATVDADNAGTFDASILIFPRDIVGPRRLEVPSCAVRARFLVQPAPLQPSRFASRR